MQQAVAYSSLTHDELAQQNRDYADTGGTSQGNRRHKFQPAFYNPDNGAIAVSRFDNGAPAPIHILDGLPPSWVETRDAKGRVSALKPGIAAGFVRDGRFYTRAQAADLVIELRQKT